MLVAAWTAALSPAASGGAGAQVAVTGVVRDSLTRQPLAGATVQLVPAVNPGADGHLVASDSSGRFRLAAVAPGRYLLGFLHPRLDSLGIEVSARTVDVPPDPGQDVVTDLAVPAAGTLVAALCGRAGDSTGAVVGRVVDAELGTPVAGAAVAVTWGELVFDRRGGRREVRRVRATADAEGRYVACGVPTGAPVGVRAHAPPRPEGPPGVARASGTFDVALTDDRQLVVQDAWVDAAPAGSATDTAAASRRGSAELVGVVRRPDGRPLAGARVALRGADVPDAAAVTGPNGRFRLTGLPGGTQAVETLAIGYAPLYTAVNLRPGRATSLETTFTMRVARLDEARVYGVRSRAAEEFERRQRTRMGYFFTGTDFARRGWRTVGDAALHTPGARALGMNRGRVIVGLPAWGRPCNPHPMIYVDGFPLIEGAVQPVFARASVGMDRPPFATTADVESFVRTGDVVGVEIYDMLQAPGRYPALDRCGVLLVWTKTAL